MITATQIYIKEKEERLFWKMSVFMVRFGVLFNMSPDPITSSLNQCCQIYYVLVRMIGNPLVLFQLEISFHFP